MLEVKVRDHLSRRQADQYTEEGGRRFAVTLFPNAPVGEGWTMFRFRDFLPVLQALRPADARSGAVVELYVDMVSTLCELVDGAPKVAQYKDITGDWQRQLEKIRLGDAWKRHAAKTFAEAVGLRGVDPEVNLNNKQATMTFWLLGREAGLGVQVEGRQLRTFVEFRATKEKATLASLEEQGWFDPHWRSEGKRLPYGTYQAPKGRVFKYQYELGTMDDWTPGKLREYLEAKRSLAKALDLPAALRQ